MDSPITFMTTFLFLAGLCSAIAYVVTGRREFLMGVWAAAVIFVAWLILVSTFLSLR